MGGAEGLGPVELALLEVDDHDLGGAGPPADLFVVAEGEVHRARRLHAGIRESLRSLHQRHERALHVDRAAAPHEAVRHDALEGRMRPVAAPRRLDGHDVHVGEEGHGRQLWDGAASPLAGSDFRAVWSADDKTLAWFEGRGEKTPAPVAPDADATYAEELTLDASAIGPQISKPHAVDNVSPIEEVEGTPIAQGVVGTCTNGRLEDLRIAADRPLQHSQNAQSIRCHCRRWG